MPLVQQADSLVKLKTPLGPDVLVAAAMHGREGISMPYRFELEVESENEEIDLDALVGQPVSVRLLAPNDEERFFHGIVCRGVQLASGLNLATYRLEVVPALWFLSLKQDCRIFQNKTVPDIINDVLNEHGITDRTPNLTGTYTARDYVVQYRESDLNFISRLMEDAGIFYFFKHEQDKHTLVIADNPAAHTPCPGQPNARLDAAATAVTGEDFITGFAREVRATSTKVSLNDYNFETPASPLLSNSGGQDKHEVYDYPGIHPNTGEGQRRAKIRLEEAEARKIQAEGIGGCRCFTAGYRFNLSGHLRQNLNLPYILVEVEHHLDAGGRRVEDSSGYSYHNRFTVIPHSVPYRPPRTAVKPVVRGTQTALVVGTAGEEIYTDKYGRVKVHFYWDRESRKDENSSCWIRVSQHWAGKNWGAIHIPRIGQEVIVDFLEGDPDRPIITGRVYNAEQMPPYTLPGNKTQSGVKSRSSLGGGTDDFNELRFEDKKGSELIYFHAQKDMETKVENDERRFVDHDRTTVITNHETETVEKGNQTTTVKMGNKTTTLDMGNQTTQLKMGNQSTKMDLGKSTHEAMQSIELIVGQSSIKVDQMGVTIKGMMIKIEGTAMIEAKAPFTQIKGDGILICKGGITLIN